MDFTGRYDIPAPPERVWEAINDPEVLKVCIPGCEQLDKTSPTDFLATARIKIGPVSATFKGKVHLSDLEPPRSLRLSGEGQGGVAGFAKGDAVVTLTPDGSGTVLSYTAKATVGGKLAQIGQRLIDGAAKQIADDFFRRFSARVAPVLEPDPATTSVEGQALSAPPVGSADAAGVPHANVPPQRGGLAPAVWVGGLIGLIAILLVIFAVAR